tara:strand:- start:1837 stop:2901 length:1065 start_codon:yes stop_codon:yes gene_type:complete
MWQGEEVYRLSDNKPFTYPPFFAMPFVITPEVPMLPPRDAGPIVAWYVVTALALVATFFLIHSNLKLSNLAPQPNWLFYLLTLLLIGRYIGSVFGNQSHDLLVLLPIMLGCHQLLRERNPSAGFCLGVAAAFKATPLLFLVLLFLQRRWTAMACMITTIIAVTLLPDLIFPRDDGQLWAWAWLTTFVINLNPGGPADTGPWHASNILNQSLSGSIHRIFSAYDWALWLSLSAQILVLALVSLSVFIREEKAPILLLAQFSAVLCGMVLLSPMSSKAHFCVLLLPAAIISWDAMVNRNRLSIGAIIVVFCLGTLTSKDLVGRELGNQLLGYGTATWLALALLIALTSFCYRQQRN